MSREIMINVSPGETRIAKFDGGRLTDLAYERERGENDVAVGDIVLGKITRVDPSINLAFVEIGTERHGVLLGYDAEPLGDEDPRERRGRPRIDRLVDEGQSVVLSVVSEAVSGKGAKLSAKITLPGQHLVFVTYREGIIFSRQISDEAEKDRLREAIGDAVPDNGGLILRTSALTADPAALQAEATELSKKWAEICEMAKDAKDPGILVQEEVGPLRALRDHLSGDVERILIDDGELVATAKEYAKEHAPELADLIQHYTEDQALFESFDIEHDIERLMSPRVPLKGGGWIMIQETEALTAIDVNSGRRRVQGGKEAMALDTNLAAVKEVAKQIRLRGLGGAFVIDLIQMREEDNMIKVEDTLDNAMKDDPLPHKVGEISDFGLLEITRKRANKPLARQLMEKCEPCDGRGAQLTVETVGLGLIREAANLGGANDLVMTTSAAVAEWLNTSGSGHVGTVKEKLGVDILVKVEPLWSRGQGDVRSKEGSVTAAPAEEAPAAEAPAKEAEASEEE